MVPSGTFIKTEKGTFLVKGNKRFRVLTKAILNSWSPPHVAEVTELDILNVPVVGKLPWRDGTLLYNASTGILYLMSDSARRRVVGGDTLRLLGLGLSDAVLASDEEMSFIKEGEILS